MLILGVILLVVGVLLAIPVLFWIGVILAIIGAVLMLATYSHHGPGRYYW